MKGAPGDSPGCLMGDRVLQRNLQTLRNHCEEQGSARVLGDALEVPKVLLSPYTPWPRKLVTAATHGKFIPGFPWKMLIHCCAHQSGDPMPIIHLLRRGLREPPTPRSSFSVPEYLFLTWKVSQRRSPCPPLPGQVPLPHKRIRQLHTLC